jgi:integrase
MRWRGSKIAVSVYDPSNGRGSRHIGSFDALDEAVEAKAEFERGKARARAGVRAWTVAEFCRVWCVTDYLRPEATTNLHNRQQTKSFCEDFGSLPMREVASNLDLCRLWALGGTVRPELERWARGWRGVERDAHGRLAVRAHYRHAKIVAAMFADARRSQIVDENPWALIKLPSSKGRQDIEPLGSVTIQALVKRAAVLFPDVPDIPALIATASYTGMRLGELIGLEWPDLDFKEHRVFVRRQFRTKVGDTALPKYGGVRRILLPPPAVEWLRLVPESADGIVFHTRTGRRYTERIHHYYWSQVRSSIDPPLPDLAFHELRHFCGSYMADKGASPRDIAHQLGHRDGGILAAKLYCHTYTENANDRLSALFGV